MPPSSSKSKPTDGPPQTIILGEKSSLLTERALVHRDSEFTVGTNYDGNSSENDMSLWQGAGLITADCVGTGLLALPAEIVTVLGWWWGLGFLVLNIPINLYAGAILHTAATAVEEKQQVENRIYSDQIVANKDQFLSVSSGLVDEEEATAAEGIKDNTKYGTTDKDTTAKVKKPHTMAHHDTATYDFIGMTNAIFHNKTATRVVMFIYYGYLFLVLGNYILVMAHALAATVGEQNICLPTAGILSSIGMFVVSQSRTMSGLGHSASAISLLAIAIVVLLCLYEIKHPSSDLVQQEEHHVEKPPLWVFFRKLSALGTISFSICSQTLFLNIRHELRDRSEAPHSLGVSLVSYCAVYGTLCFAAGPNPPSFLFEAIPKGTTNRRIAGFLLWVHVVVSYALNSQALCSSIDRIVWQKLNLPGLGEDSPPARRWMLLTGFVAAIAYTVANGIPFFKDLVAFTGATTLVPLCLLLPALYWRAHLEVPLWTHSEGTGWSLALLYFSVILTIATTVGSVHSIGQDWENHGAPFACHAASTASA